MKKKSVFLNGISAGLPIGLGYFAVAFSLGIVAKHAGLSPLQGFWASFLNLASAGEYALFTAIQQGASLLQIALVTFIVNARYLLMSCALSQRFDEKTGFLHRVFVGYAITDELFGIAISRHGKLNPYFSYGAMLVAVPLWSLGTFFGIIAGNALPKTIVDSLSFSLYGMFLAIIIPPCKREKPILLAVGTSFLLSFVFSVAPFLKNFSSGNRTIFLTILISAVFALVFPIKDSEEEEK